MGEALDNALAAAAAAPDQTDAHYLSGIISERLSAPDRAIASYTRYLALAPRGAIDKRAWVEAEIDLLRSFGPRIPVRDAASVAAPHTIPFRIIDDKMVGLARVNGGPPIDLDVDTGAETTVLSQGSATRFGVAAISGTLGAGIGGDCAPFITRGSTRSR